MRAATRVDGRQARWDDHNAERRRQVLDAAVELLEELPPGSDVHVQQIAERAGLVRTVVYRHFKGRADLNRAVQAHVVDRIRAELEPTLEFRGSIAEIIDRIVGSYVAWVAEHPNLHEVSERALGDGLAGELDRAIEETSDQFSTLIRTGAQVLGLKLEESQLAALDLLVVGLIGQVRGTVGLWVRRPDRAFNVAALTRLLSQWVWFQIDGQARELGVQLDANLPVERLGELRAGRVHTKGGPTKPTARPSSPALSVNAP